MENAKLHHLCELPVYALKPFIGHSWACGQGAAIDLPSSKNLVLKRLNVRDALGTPGSTSRNFVCVVPYVSNC